MAKVGLLNKAASKADEAFTGLMDYIRAYHGSPYKFDQFDINKMGSGEGAQAYGWGLYFAENPDVARGYRSQLAPSRVSLDNIAESMGIDAKAIEAMSHKFGKYTVEVLLDDTPIPEIAQRMKMSVRELRNVPDKTIREMLEKFKSETRGTDLTKIYSELTGRDATDLDYQKAEIIEQMMIDNDALGVIERQRDYKSYSPEAYKWFEEEIEPKFNIAGGLYEVNLKAKPNELLDWDKPFSKQSQTVKNAVEKIINTPFEESQMYRQLKDQGFSDLDIARYKPAYENRIESVKDAMQESGSRVYDKLSWLMGTNPKQASLALDAAGIKGIRYFDRMSRGKGYQLKLSRKGEPYDTEPIYASDDQELDRLIQDYKQKGYDVDVENIGTSNFVVFDPRIIDIAKRFGVSLPVAQTILAGGILGTAALSPQQVQAGLLSTGTKVARSVADETKRLIDMGYPESVAERIASGDLVMDYASRMKRASEQGYDPRTYYHGGAPNLLSIDPTVSSSRKTEGTGTWFSDMPEVANSYLSKDSQLYPVRINTQGMDMIDAEGAGWASLPSKNLMRDGVQKYPYPDDHTLSSDVMANMARKGGRAGLVIDNVVDLGPNGRMPKQINDDWRQWLLDYEQKGGRSVSVQDPNRVRSVNAAFDPEYVGPNILGNADPMLLAGLAGAGLLGAMAPQEAQAGALTKISDLIKRGYPESVAQRMASGELDMSPQARLARAEAFGQDVYHASKQDILEFKAGYDDDQIFTTPNIDFANNWLGKGKYRFRLGTEDEISSLNKAEREFRESFFDYDLLEKIEKEQGKDAWIKAYDEMQKNYLANKGLNPDDAYKTIYPLKAKAEKTFDPSKDYEKILPVIEKYYGSLSEETIDLIKKGHYMPFENAEVTKWLRDNGYDSIKLSENADGRMTTFAVLSPNQLRSVNAAFDPEYTGSNILGSRVAPTVTTGLLGAGAMVGEVEARNIEERDQPRGLMREFMPESTEDPRFPRNEQIVMDRSLSPYLDENMDVVPYRQPLDINYPRQVTVGEAKTPEANYNLLDAAVPAAIAYDYGNGANLPVRPAQGLLAPEPKPETKPEPMKLDTTMVPAGVPINPYTFMMSTGADQGEAARYAADAYTNIARGVGNAIGGVGGEMESLGKGLMYAIAGQGLGGSPWGRLMHVLDKYNPQLPNTQDVGRLPALLPNVSPMTEEERRMNQLAGETIASFYLP